MLILGVNPAENASAAFVLDGRLVFAAEEERFVGEKHVRALPVQAIGAGLAYLGARLRDVDVVTMGWRPWLGAACRARGSLAMVAPGSVGGISERGGTYLQLVADAWLVRRRLVAAWPGEPPHFRVTYWPHHLAHAAAVYYCSGEPEAAILTVDGAGDRETAVLWRARDGAFQALERCWFPDSLGHFYSVLTSFLGFGVGDGEGKTMGLSAYGEPRFAEPLRRWTTAPDGALRLDVRRINYAGARARRFHHDVRRTLGDPIRCPDAADPRHCDIASSAQTVLEGHMMRLVSRLARRAPAPALCLSGGVALNCACNARLFELGAFDRIHACPAPTDAGTSPGAALLEAGRHGATPSVPDPVFLGPRDVTRLPSSVPGTVSMETPSAADSIAELLARGLVVGVFQDRMELGPRALGNRSILAPGAPAGMKDRVNNGVKFREPFRPFAPAVMAEHIDEYFYHPSPSPYMSFAYRARPKAREELPAVVHVDGTGRLQTVDRERFPLFHEVLERYRDRTGCAGVLNTSLNVRGKPIVATKQEALRLLLETDLDALVADEQVYVKTSAAGGPGRNGHLFDGARRHPSCAAPAPR